MKFLMLHGINHNMFGKRDPKQYGTITLDEINASLSSLGQELGVEVEHFQSADIARQIIIQSMADYQQYLKEHA